MTDKELMQQALDALELVTANMLDCRDQLAERGGRPTTNVVHQRLWDAAHKTYTDNAIPVAEALRARLAQGEPEPVAWITTWNEKENAGVELHWAKLDKGASAKHTPLYTKEQLLDAAQKLADSAALNSFPPQREWQSVGTDAEILELSKDAWGREKLKYGRTDHTQFYIDFARAIEAKLKEKNT